MVGKAKTRRHDWQEMLCGECWGHRHRGQGSWKGGLALHPQWSWDHDQELNQILWTRRATEDFEGVKLSDTCHRRSFMWQWRKRARNLIHQEAIKISRVELLRTLINIFRRLMQQNSYLQLVFFPPCELAEFITTALEQQRKNWLLTRTN